MSWSFTYICHRLSGLLGPAIVWRACRSQGAASRGSWTQNAPLCWTGSTPQGGEESGRWGGARLPLIVIPCTMGLGAGGRSRSWALELLGERMTAAGTWLQVWCPRELERRSGTLLAGGFSRSLLRASVRKKWPGNQADLSFEVLLCPPRRCDFGQVASPL